MEYSYDYSICTEADDDIFFKQCKALEKHVPNIEKGKLLEDVDGSFTQLYSVSGKEIVVHDSYYIGAVYIESEIDLEQFFQK